MSQKTKQRKRRKKKLKRRNKKRRKRDVIMGLPFLIAYLGDPARHFRCGQADNYREYFDLINASKDNTERNTAIKGFNQLNKYKDHQVLDFGIAGKTMGLVYIKDAA